MGLASTQLVDKSSLHCFALANVGPVHKPDAPHMHVLYGVVGGVEVVSNRSVTGVSSVCYVFLEAYVEGSACFADVNFLAVGALDGVNKVVGLAGERLSDVEGAFRSN